MSTKTAVITGAAGGIGRAAAFKFAHAGYQLVLVDQHQAGLEKLCNDLGNAASVTSCTGDLSSVEFLQDITDHTIASFGVPHVLVNNAAWRTIETMRTISEEKWNKTLQVCLNAPAFLSQKMAALMEAEGRKGVLLFVSSMMTDRPAGNSPAYICAKAGIEALIRELAVTYGRSGIRVLGIKPGYIDTDLSRDYTRSIDHTDVSQQLIDYVLDATPLERAGRPEEIADAMVWLSSEASGFITGTTLTLDGGFSINMNAYSLKKNLFPDEY